MERGKFITFEGCEGVGKSTQLRFLREYLEKSGQPALFTREPGGNHISELIRGILLSPENRDIDALTEAYLYAASRAQLTKEVILPALSRGGLVICDRFLDSSLAYQGYARGLGIDKVAAINAQAVEGVVPDCTVFIDLSAKESFRSRQRSESLNDRFELEAVEFHEKVYQGYLILAERAPERFIKIKPSKIKDETSAKIIAALKTRGFIA